MNTQNYYFNRDAETLAVGAVIDSLSKKQTNIFRRLHVEGEDYEQIGEEIGLDPELVESIEETVFEYLKPIVELLMGKEFEADDILNDVEKDFVIDIFRNEIHFREDRANYMNAWGLSHVPK
jgi:hypothetical protein